MGAIFEEDETRKNHLKAVTAYEKACNLDDALGCFKLGNLYEMGSTIQKNPKKAINYYLKSCSLGYRKACSKTLDMSIGK